MSSYKIKKKPKHLQLPLAAIWCSSFKVDHENSEEPRAKVQEWHEEEATENSPSLLWWTVLAWQRPCETLWPSLVADRGLPRVKSRRLLPDHRALAKDSVTALQRFYSPRRWLQQATFHFSFSSFLQLSIPVLIRPINLETFQQSLYYYSLETVVFTQAQFLDISSSSLQSNDSTPTSVVPELEDIFTLFLCLTWLGLSSLGSQSFSCLLSSWLMLWIPQ